MKELFNELNEEKNENKKLSKEILRLKNLLKSSEVRMKVGPLPCLLVGAHTH